MGCSTPGRHPLNPSRWNAVGLPVPSVDRICNGTEAGRNAGQQHRTKETKVPVGGGGHLTAGWLPVWLGLTSFAVPKVRGEEKARAPLSPGIAADLPVLRLRG